MPFADLSGLALHYRVTGPEGAPRVVFLNSLGTDCRIWQGLLSEMGDGVRALRYDERGQGLSDCPPGPYSIGDHARDLLALLDHLQWGRTVLCGLSIGGMIALEACSRRPGAVSGLVLADTSYKIGPREVWDERMREVRETGLARIAGTVMERWFGTSFRRERPADSRGWAHLLERAPVGGYLGSCAALRDADLSERLAAIAEPALCVCGSEDTPTPPAAVQDLADRLPDAEYAEIRGAGHLAPVERPAEFAGLLTRFLEERVGD